MTQDPLKNLILIKLNRWFRSYGLVVIESFQSIGMASAKMNTPICAKPTTSDFKKDNKVMCYTCVHAYLNGSNVCLECGCKNIPMVTPVRENYCDKCAYVKIKCCKCGAPMEKFRGSTSWMSDICLNYSEPNRNSDSNGYSGCHDGYPQ